MISSRNPRLLLLGMSTATLVLRFSHVQAGIGMSAAFTRNALASRAGAIIHTSSSSATSSSSSSCLLSSSSSTPEDYDFNELPGNYPRRNDVLIALSAVRKACVVTQAIQPTSSADSANSPSSSSASSSSSSQQIATVTKADLSPVTLGDYSAQALVLRHLHRAFANDSFIAEESSGALKEDEDLANQIRKSTGLSSTEDVMEGIDLGKMYEHWDDNDASRPERVWTLDPIDGTKGFLRGKRSGGQYCVALALLENGVPTIGILGCPNLPMLPNDDRYVWDESETDDNNQNSRGCIFVASQGGGCYQLPLTPGILPAKRVHVTPQDESVMGVQNARFCIGVEKGFGDFLGQMPDIAKIIHGEDMALDEDGEIIKSCRIDSQAKYGVLARGGGEFYVRLPKPGYQEWIWDQAAGCVVITEAGGKMTDVDGNDIDFSLGAKLSTKVRGVLGSNGGKFHDALVQAYQQQESVRAKDDTKNTPSNL